MAWQEYLINCVSLRRCLWDNCHPEYKDARTVKQNNWMHVAKEMTDLTGLQCTGRYDVGVYITTTSIYYYNVIIVMKMFYYYHSN